MIAESLKPFVGLFISLLTLFATSGSCDDSARYLIGLKRNGVQTADVRTLERDARSLGIHTANSLGLGNSLPLARILTAQLSSAEVSRLASDAKVEFIEKVVTYHQSELPNDTLYAQGLQWGLGSYPGINVADSWQITHGSAAAISVVIDSGIDLRHPELASKLWRNPAEIDGNGIDDDGNGYIDDVIGYDFVGRDNNPGDSINGHGTHVSGIIAAASNNGVGIAGISWNAPILPLKAIGDDGTGDSETISEAIYYAIGLKRRGIPIAVINMSLGGSAPSEAMRRACYDAGVAGIVVVAAAGNESKNNDQFPSFPANYAVDMAHVLSVAAVTRGGTLAQFSNFGGNSVDIGAPGDEIVSTFLVDDLDHPLFASFSGTSMAAPHVAGAVALMATVRSVTPALTATFIRQSAAPMLDLMHRSRSGGILDVTAAIAALKAHREPVILSGTITGPQGPLAGVTVTIPEVAAVRTTSTLGSYTVDGILDQTTVTVVPTLAGYLFVPPFKQITVAGDSQLDFVGRPSIWSVDGTISVGRTKVSGSRISLISLTSSGIYFATSKRGVYHFASIPDGNYSLSVRDKRYKFKPPTVIIQVQGGNVIRSFKGTLLPVSGRR